MVQDFTPTSSHLRKRFSVGSLVLAAFVWLAGLSAAPIMFDHPAPDYAMPGDTTIEASICANQTYPFDGELLNTSGTYTATYTASDGTDSVVTLNLSVLPIAETELSADICEGESYAFNGQSLTLPGFYQAILMAANGCDSLVNLKLRVFEPKLTELYAGICEGSKYIFQGDTLTESGTYETVLTSEEGCDSTVILTLDVAPFFDVFVAVTICDNEAYIFGNDTLTMPGLYVDSLTASGGCDSTVTLRLRVLPTAGTATVAGICTGSTYIFQGDTLSSSGIYVVKLTAANGCDSTLVLDLTVADSFDLAAAATICAGETYIFGEDTLSAAGIYTGNFLAAGGCDSTVTLTLTVLPVQSETDAASICAGDSLLYLGETLTEAGVYDFVLQGSNGCDSTVTLTLTVLPQANTALEAAICPGETYDFNGQSLDSSGVYSVILPAANGCDSTVTLALTVLATQKTTLQAAICEGEIYEYEGDTLTIGGNYDYVFSGVNGCDSTVTLVLTVNLPQNVAINANICEGGAYTFDGEILTEEGIYEATFTGSNGCDSTVTLTLAVLPVKNTALSVSICATETYPFNGQNLNMAGTYTAVLMAANGCDSTVVLTLEVRPTQNTSLSVTICEGESYVYNSQMLTTAGAYDFIFEGANGCDSMVTVNLAVLPVAKTIITASICEGETYDYDGESLTESGTYAFTFDGANGCDSIVTVELTVRPLLSSTLNIKLCEGETFVFDGDTLSESGTYQAVFTGSNGCDSTQTLNLSFVSAFETNLQASICSGESYTFDGEDLTESGEYSLTLTAVGGCDSIINLALTVLPLPQSTTAASICAGESYDFNGQSLTESGTYTATLMAANGCDSTAVLNLAVLPAINTALTASICANDSIQFNGQVLTEEGSYTATLTAANGCDSTVTLALTVLPLKTTALTMSICANDSVQFNGQTLSQSGTYTANLATTSGCDSTVTLQLTVLPLAQGAFAVTVCGGLPYTYQNETLTESGTYEFVFEGEAANGCDSVVTLYLTIFPAIPPTNVAASVCDGQSYDFYGNILTMSGTYSTELPSATGCDSTIVLTLTVLPKLVTNITATICEGEQYPFNGQSLTIPGLYEAVLPSAAGCDSTVSLILAVNAVNLNVSLESGTLTAQASDATFQWINCANNQPIAGATSNTFKPTVTGSYAVVVTQNGCTATSTCVTVQVSSVRELMAQSAWAVQPNPAQLYAQVVFQQALETDIWLDIHDPAGRLLLRQRVASGTLTVDVDLTDLPEGVLMVRLLGENSVSVKRLMKAEH